MYNMSTPVDDEAQQDEMLAMESIFDGDTFQIHEGDIRSGQIKIRLDLPTDPFYVTVAGGGAAAGETTTAAGTIPTNTTTTVHSERDENINDADSDIVNVNEDVGGNELKYKVEFLPPLILHFTLPKNYPSQAKPNFTLSSAWLHRASLSVLCQKLDELWEENEGMGVLFTWANYLQTNSLPDLGIVDQYDVAWHTRPYNLSRNKYPSKKRGSIVDNNTTTISALDDTVDTDQINEPSEESSSVGGAEAAVPMQRGRKRKCRSRRGKVNLGLAVDQRAASEMIPRKEGKEASLLDYLLSFNEEQVRETFLQSSHMCDICFSRKSGHVCVRFRCSHSFCEECVAAFFITNISEGSVDQVKCLAFNCKMRPSPELVKELVGPELFERYDQILLKRALESMTDITYCPRPKCHNPVICDPNEKCAFCTACGYTFCSICKMVYHGVESCRFKDADMKDVFRKYTEGNADEKKELLRTYGEKQLKVLVENVLSEQWIQNESKPCPHCKVPIEKFEGCNKVTCYKCNTYFCWLCLKQLETGNPYFHFNDPSSKCYNNLFQDVDDGPGNEWFVVEDSDSEDDNEIGDLNLDGSDFEDSDLDFFE